MAIPEGLSGPELDDLAEALFWQDRQQDSLEAWRRAYSAHIAVDDVERATHAVWRVFVEHFLVGEATLAGGWLERGRRHAAEVRESAADGFITIATSMWAGATGDLTAAVTHARRAQEIGGSTGDSNVLALAMATEGRTLVDLGEVDDGMSVLDDAMVSVISDDLAPLYTGWIYCTMLGACHDLADLGRAADWSEAATRWCDSLSEGQLYPGLCRMYRVELLFMRGGWDNAINEAEQACEQIVAHDSRYAGEAYYVLGEIRRLTGEIDAADEAYHRAQDLGRDPQPGLAELRRTQGRTVDALRALRAAAEGSHPPARRRVQLLAALARAEIEVGDVDAARQASARLEAFATELGNRPWLDAMAASVSGEVALAAGNVVDALDRLRRAHAAFVELGMPYEAACVRLLIAPALTRSDPDAGQRELEAATAVLRSLGAPVETAPTSSAVDGLSSREVEVLREVARGRTNREVGEALFISEHTVARHLSNIFTKLGVNSRTAATSYAHEHDLV